MQLLLFISTFYDEEHKNKKDKDWCNAILADNWGRESNRQAEDGIRPCGACWETALIHTKSSHHSCLASLCSQAGDMRAIYNETDSCHFFLKAAVPFLALQSSS